MNTAIHSRKYIGIKFTVGHNIATGGAMYFIHIIRCLKMLPPASQPNLVIFYTQNTNIDSIKSVDYPYVEYVLLDDERAVRKPTLWVRLVNKVSRILLKKDVIEFPYQFEPYKRELDCVYELYAPNPLFVTRAKRCICWIADFQHKYFPDNFSVDEYKWMESAIEKVGNARYEVALSSQDCVNDYVKFYNTGNNTIHLLRFTPILPEITHLSLPEVKKKYAIHKKYFIISNQFWPHKNHMNVLKAIHNLKTTGYLDDVAFVFTGLLQSHRTPEYIENIKQYIVEAQLEDKLHFLGLIPREEQLALIKGSLAIIQPSFFEGWSTIVEDCKALNHFILLSNLRVHREQMEYSSYENHLFFDPSSYESLVAAIKNVLENGYTLKPFDYSQDIQKYVQSLQKMYGL